MLQAARTQDRSRNRRRCSPRTRPSATRPPCCPRRGPATWPASGDAASVALSAVAALSRRASTPPCASPLTGSPSVRRRHTLTESTKAWAGHAACMDARHGCRVAVRHKHGHPYVDDLMKRWKEGGQPLWTESRKAASSRRSSALDQPFSLTVARPRAEAQLDAAAVPALLGAPAAVFRRLGSAERRERLAALAGRRVVASLYAGIGHGAAVHIAAVRLLDAEAPPQSKQRRGR